MMNLRQALIGAASLIALTVPASPPRPSRSPSSIRCPAARATTGEIGLKHDQF